MSNVNVKKMYQEIHELLIDSKNKKVSTILPMLEEMMMKKKKVMMK